jgi:hypothetical protein
MYSGLKGLEVTEKRAQAKTLLTLSPLVFGSNVRRETDYYKIFDAFLSSARQMLGLYP